MLETYIDGLNWIQSQLKFGIKPGLERMTYMLEKLGNPEKNIKAVHIAGTNGKGSTVSYLSHMLQEASYQVGTFTSPYIEQFNERISVNGKPISDEEMLQLVRVVKPIVEETRTTEHGDVTEFEIITLMSMYYFGAMNPVDYVIYETGMGGRLDSTNVIMPILTIITTIGFDHMEVLGDTVEKITFEKAGIMKKNIPTITGVKQPEGIEVIKARAKEENSHLLVKGEDFFVEHLGSSTDGEEFSFISPLGNMTKWKISMKGMHQVENGSLALMAVLYLRENQAVAISEEQMGVGLLKTKWIGRFECMQENPLVIVDGAHNPEGIASLTDTIKSHYGDKKTIVLFSALGDKKLAEMVAGLEKFAHRLVFTTFDYPRAIPPKEIAKYAKMDYELADDYEKAIEEIIANMTDEVFIITGSLYFISLVRELFKKDN